MLVNGATGDPSSCSRTGRDAPQIDPRSTLRTDSLVLTVGCKHPAILFCLWQGAERSAMLVSQCVLLVKIEVNVVVVPSQRSGSTSSGSSHARPRLQSVDSDTALDAAVRRRLLLAAFSSTARDTWCRRG